MFANWQMCGLSTGSGTPPERSELTGFDWDSVYPLGSSGERGTKPSTPLPPPFLKVMDPDFTVSECSSQPRSVSSQSLQDCHVPGPSRSIKVKRLILSGRHAPNAEALGAQAAGHSAGAAGALPHSQRGGLLMSVNNAALNGSKHLKGIDIISA